MPTVPYVTTAAFGAHPTYLDLGDLRSGDSSATDQTGELNNLLVMASAWADNYCEQPLAAHQNTQQQRARCDRYGFLKLHPDHTPILSFTSLAYGYTPSAMTTLTDLSDLWIEDGRNIVIPLAGGTGAWSGSLQFGAPAAGSELFVRVTYLAGWVSTTLGAGAAAGATALQVADPTGILPGQTYRIWEPGSEETVTVSTTWTPPAVTTPPTPTSVPLAVATGNAHTAGMGLSGMPADVHLAVISYAVSQLMRPDTASEDSYPDTRFASGTRQTDSRKDGSGLVVEAERLLEPFRRVR